MDEETGMRSVNINNIKIKIILSIFIGGIIIFGVIIGTVGKIVYEETIGIHTVEDMDKGIENIYEESPEIIEKFYNYKSQELSIPSRNSYNINGIYIESPQASNKTVAIVHGLDSNKWEMIEWAFMYLDNGYNVVLYNQRGTGETGGKGSTFGYYEKDDLASVIDYMDTNYPSKLIGTHGFSMGGTTVALYAGMKEANEKIDFFILDSPYNGIEEAIKAEIDKMQIPLVPITLLAWLEDKYLELTKGFGYDDVLPKEAIKSSTIPMLIIHGDLDTHSPIEMGVDIYNNKQKGYKDLWIIEGGNHMSGYRDNPEEYEKRVMGFIEMITYMK